MKNLRKLRQENGFSCEHLGELVHVKKAAISKYELGQIQPSQEVLRKLAEVLNTTTDYLLGISEISERPGKKKEPIEITGSQLKLLNEFEGLMLEDKQKAIDYVLLLKKARMP